MSVWHCQTLWHCWHYDIVRHDDTIDNMTLSGMMTLLITWHCQTWWHCQCCDIVRHDDTVDTMMTLSDMMTLLQWVTGTAMGWWMLVLWWTWQVGGSPCRSSTSVPSPLSTKTGKRDTDTHRHRVLSNLLICTLWIGLLFIFVWWPRLSTCTSIIIVWLHLLISITMICPRLSTCKCITNLTLHVYLQKGMTDLTPSIYL